MCANVCICMSIWAFCPFSLTPFLISLFVTSCSRLFDIILSYFIIVSLFLDACYILRRERKSVDLGRWEDLGGVGEGEAIIIIYCMKKIYFQGLQKIMQNSPSKQGQSALFGRRKKKEGVRRGREREKGEWV